MSVYYAESTGSADQCSAVLADVSRILAQDRAFPNPTCATPRSRPLFEKDSVRNPIESSFGS